MVISTFIYLEMNGRGNENTGQESGSYYLDDITTQFASHNKYFGSICSAAERGRRQNVTECKPHTSNLNKFDFIVNAKKIACLILNRYYLECLIITI